MKRVEKIWAELREAKKPKRNLSKQPKKVQLGIIQDVIQDFKKGMDLFTDAKSSMDRASEILNAAEELYKKAEQDATDLGLDLGSETKKFGERLKSIAQEARDFIKR